MPPPAKLCHVKLLRLSRRQMSPYQREKKAIKGEKDNENDGNKEQLDNKCSIEELTSSSNTIGGSSDEEQDIKTKDEPLEEDDVKVKEKTIAEASVGVEEEPLTGVEMNEEPLTGDVEVKEEPLTGDVEVNEEPLTDVEVKEEPLTDVEVKEEPLTDVEVKEEPLTDAEMEEDPLEDEGVTDSADEEDADESEADVAVGAASPSNMPLPEFVHAGSNVIKAPFMYFTELFDKPLVEHLVYYTNLNARQSKNRTPFKTETPEMLVFLGILIHMGIVQLPSIEDYWAAQTRVPQVADSMASKRFRQLRALLHFNNDQQSIATQDRFYKIRPVINSVTKKFLMIPATREQSVDKVIFSYMGNRDGLRQVISSKLDKWGYKWFCRASTDGIIHDIILYQGKTTFVAHPTQFLPEEACMNVKSKIFISLVKKLTNPDGSVDSVVYASNFFPSIGLVEHLRDKYKCWYVSMSTEKTNNEKTVLGTLEHKSGGGVLALKCKDNKAVHLLSTDAEIEPTSSVRRYDREAKEEIEVPCPSSIKPYNDTMRGINKSYMLTHLYETPLR